MVIGWRAKDVLDDPEVLKMQVNLAIDCIDAVGDAPQSSVL
jgi:hypothetical protein